jgi:hypothetical protein
VIAFDYNKCWNEQKYPLSNPLSWVQFHI